MLDRNGLLIFRPYWSILFPEILVKRKYKWRNDYEKEKIIDRSEFGNDDVAVSMWKYGRSR